MTQLNSFKKKVLNGQIEDFSSFSLELFRFQYASNPVYRKYVNNLSLEPSSIKTIDDIPFMPIEFFKHNKIKTKDWKEEYVFKSSGTSGLNRSHHFIEDLGFYEAHSNHLFTQAIGDLSDCAVFGLLPSYAEQGESSLICMVDYLMTKADESGYFLEDFKKLETAIIESINRNKKVFLFGVGYALLDFSDFTSQSLNGLSIIETGGMKGRREEMTKPEFYNFLKKGLGSIQIYSEYGMTELMSQAYSKDSAIFHCPASMKVLIRELQDPFSYQGYNKTGGINVIDLANIHSCAFIETQDVGKNYENGTFEVLGRIDNSDIRGCNLLID